MATEAEYVTAKTLRDDLKEVYLTAYDSFAIDPGEVVDSIESVTNVRYARELLGILTNQKILAISDGDNGDIWQVLTPGTPDEIERDTAEAFITNWLDTAVPLPDYNPNHNVNNPNRKSAQKESKMSTTATKPASAPSKEITFHKCGCGCNENIAGKAMYKPGHDARHAGQVARLLLATRPETEDEREQTLAVLPTAALRDKASALATLWIAKADAKDEKEAQRLAAKIAKEQAKVPEWTDLDPITVGKTAFPARQHRDGHIERNSKKDGSGRWLEVLTD